MGEISTLPNTGTIRRPKSLTAQAWQIQTYGGRSGGCSSLHSRRTQPLSQTAPLGAHGWWPG